jgi:hypothetical protein
VLCFVGGSGDLTGADHSYKATYSDVTEHVALHASHAALRVVTLKLSPCTNVTLTFDFDFGQDHPVHGDMGEGALHGEDKVTVKQRN